MIESIFGLLVLPPQVTKRVDFDLEPGVVLVAILAFVLINLLLAAVLYPYLSSDSSERQASAGEPAKEEMVGETSPDDGEPLEERVDDFLEDIERGR